jgi:predicted dehydrogenase
MSGSLKIEDVNGAEIVSNGHTLKGVGIVGCGLIGQKRAKALDSRTRLVACADTHIEKAAALAHLHQASAYADWRQVLSAPDVDLVVISTLHDSLAEIALAAISAKKHVLIEKPAARTWLELEPLIHAAKEANVRVRVGFNHRYHPAIQKAKELVDADALGELMFIRARYGHGARLGYETEWRADPKLSGGGELIDQGPHLIDLARYFLGDFTEIQGFAHTYFWDMPVDDNGFMLLKTASKKVAFLHVSCTEWKNLFSMEIYGRLGKLDLNGLGGSYGAEKITHYKMLPKMGPPDSVTWEYASGDGSWALEMTDFIDDILLNREPSANLGDAVAALKVIQQVYKDSGYDHCS